MRRLVAILPLALGVLTVVFLLLEVLPGRPFGLEPGTGVRPGAADDLRRIFAADRPLVERYLDWLRGFLTGDLGISFAYRRPVGALISEAAGNTVTLAGLALAMQFLLGTAAGTAAAAADRKSIDRLITGTSSVLYSVPSFWLAVVLVSLVSVRLGWLPVSQMRSLDAAELGPWPRLVDVLRHLVLPCLSLALPAAAGIALYVRDEMRATLARGFIQAARARGTPRAGVVLRHGLAGVLRPVITLFGLAVPGLLGGSVVIEVLFAWPGMGRLAYQAVLSRDEPLVLGCTWVASLAVIASSLAADLLAAAVDPRVREATP